MRSIVVWLLLVLAVASAAAQGKVGDQDAYKAAAEYSRDNRGVAMVVVKGGDIVFEDYPTIGSRDLPWPLASGTKSFVGVLCAAAIDDKLISSFDEKVSETITEWKSDPRKAKITVRQLLSLTSGIDTGPIVSSPGYSASVSRAAMHEPGSHFQYGPVPFQIFGELLARKLKPKSETVAAYLDRRILDPIGLDAAYWRETKGEPLLPHGAVLTAREWAKFGRLVRDRGRFNGKQIIKAELIDQLLVGSKANPAYGLTFWLNEKGKGPGGGDKESIAGDIGTKKIADGLDVFMAAGAGNQRLYVIRSLDLVVVRFGAFGDYDDREFITRLIGENPKQSGR